MDDKIKEIIKDTLKYIDCEMCSCRNDEKYCSSCNGAKHCYWSPADWLVNSMSEQIIKILSNK